jgi:hypothetical protein
MLQVYRYRFAPGVDLGEAEDTLLLAMLAAEGLLGEARVRMDAAYAVDESIRAIVVDASTVVGQIVSAIFTTLVLREFGRQAVDVRRFEGLTRTEDGR